MSERSADLAEWAAQALGHRFGDADLLARALTHASMGAAGWEFERLEFLGDRVLGLAVADLLYRAHAAEPEGALARRHAELVRRETLAAVADDMGLHDRLSHARDGHARARATILADVLEAVLGAAYLDGGWDAARGVVERLWSGRIATLSHPPQDAKTRLQEWAQARRRGLPAYSVRRTEGPDHAPQFEAEVTVEGLGTARSSGDSKRAAEQAAAARLLAEGRAGEGA